MTEDTTLITIYKHIQNITSEKFTMVASNLNTAFKTLKTNIDNLITELKMKSTWDDEVIVETSGETSIALATLIDNCQRPIENVINHTGPLVNELKTAIEKHIESVENYNLYNEKLIQRQKAKPDRNDYGTDEESYNSVYSIWESACERLNEQLVVYKEDAEYWKTYANQKKDLLTSMLVPNGSYKGAISMTMAGASITEFEETTANGYIKRGTRIIDDKGNIVEEEYEIYNETTLIKSGKQIHNDDGTTTDSYIFYSNSNTKSGTIYYDKSGNPIREIYETELPNGQLEEGTRIYSNDGTSKETYLIRNGDKSINGGTRSYNSNGELLNSEEINTVIPTEENNIVGIYKYNGQTFSTKEEFAKYLSSISRGQLNEENAMQAVDVMLEQQTATFIEVPQEEIES